MCEAALICSADAQGQTLTSAGINSPSGKTYLARMRAICDTSGVLPTSMVLPGSLEGLGTRPVNLNGSANIHKAIYQGRTVAVKALMAHSMETPDNTHKVRIRLFRSIITYAHLLGSLAVGQGGDWVGMASA